MKLLIVDDESAVRDSIARALKVDGHNVRTAADGLDALAELADDPVDVIILDVQMPRMNGLMLCRSLRATGDATPILMLTARTSIADRVDGLDAGADDYLVKPFALDELKARLRALVRRNTAIADIENAELRFGDLALNTATRVARRGDRVLDSLTRTEFSLLELLLLNPQIVLTREVIFDRVWGYDFGANSNSLEVYIGYLRRKTEAAGEPRLVHTIRGVGYVLREP